MTNGIIVPSGNIIYKDYTFQNVAIDLPYNDLYYKGSLDISVSNAIPISVNIVTWGGGMTDLVVPYISQTNQSLGLISKSNITVATITIRVAYIQY